MSLSSCDQWIMSSQWMDGFQTTVTQLPFGTQTPPLQRIGTSLLLRICLVIPYQINNNHLDILGSCFAVIGSYSAWLLATTGIISWESKASTQNVFSYFYWKLWQKEIFFTVQSNPISADYFQIMCNFAHRLGAVKYFRAKLKTIEFWKCPM